MKLLLTALGAFTVLMVALSLAGASTPASAGPSVTTTDRPQYGEDDCEVPYPDEGDDDWEEDEDENDGGNDDDASTLDVNVQQPVEGDDRGHDDGSELDDCWGPRSTEAPGSETPICRDISAANDICCSSSDAGVCGSGSENGNSGEGEPNPEPAGTSDGPADANCDGGVDGSDALAVLSYASGAGEGCTGDGESGDADCSGSVDAIDASRILLVAAGLESAGC